MTPRTTLWAACAGLAVVLSACTSSSGPAAEQARRQDAVITVGSFGFAESVLLAQIYGQALAAGGYPVRVLPDLGPRELVEPALMNGLLQVVPEYAGSALEFLSLGHRSPTADVQATSRALASLLAGRGLLAARPAAAQDANAIVVTAATAARYHLRSIADLAAVAPRLVFGGPPECPERAYCLRGLQRIYGVRFKAFVPLDTGGPLTLQALRAGASPSRCSSRPTRPSRRSTWWCWPMTGPCSLPRTSRPWCAVTWSPGTARACCPCSTRCLRG